MFSKSRLTVALAMVLALAVSGVAFGTASLNDARVEGDVSPSKLDKNKYKKASLFLGLLNSSDHITGTQSNPASEYISIGKNVKLDLTKAPLCPVTIPNGTPTDVAKAQCPAGSVLGSGDAEVRAAPNGTTLVAEPVVTVFNGPGKGQLQLHTYSTQTGQASPVVPATIVKSTDGSQYGQALKVPASPETGGIMITKFNSLLEKSSGVVTARCKSKKTPFLRTVVYKDGTTEQAEVTDKCKRRR